MDMYLHVRVLFGMIVGLSVAHLLRWKKGRFVIMWLFRGLMLL